MRRTVNRGVVVGLVLGSMMAFGVAPLVGQDSASGQTDLQALEAEAQRLFTAAEEKRQELIGFRDQLDRVTGEDERALRERALDLFSEYVDVIDALAANTVKREERGADAAADRQQVTDSMETSSALMQSSVDETRTKLRDLRQALDSATGGDALTIERELAFHRNWLTRVLDLLLDHTRSMEGFGIDVGAERTFLSDNLVELAELLSGRILLAKEQRGVIEKRLKADPANADLTAELDRIDGELNRSVDGMNTLTKMMDELGLDTADYQQLLFQVTGEITTGLFSRDVMTGLLQSWADRVIDWIGHNGPGLILKLVLFAAILLVFRLLSKIARKIVKQAISRSSLGFSKLLERTALSVTGTVVMLLGLLVALSQLGFQVGPLLAGLGVVGFIVGFALQDTLSNFASGVMILLYRPYDVGDLVEVAGGFGKVQDMTLVSTTILTLDHQTLVIPNNKIWGDVIKNVTAQKVRRVDMVFGIGYADDIPHAERVLTEIVEAHDKVLDDPEPIVKLHTLGESSVDFIVRPWVLTDDYWDVYWDITREVKIRFDAEKISIPFPQRDVHVFRETGDDVGGIEQ